MKLQKKRYHLYVNRENKIQENKFLDLASEIRACLNCGDSIEIRDTLRDRFIPQSEIESLIGWGKHIVWGE